MIYICEYKTFLGIKGNGYVVYQGVRYYSPTAGRFISRDSDPGTSADPLSLNLYTYCHNNLVLYTDPSGHGVFSKIGSGIKKVAKAVKNWANDRVDDWKTGIVMLKESGGAGEVFASYKRT